MEHAAQNMKKLITVYFFILRQNFLTGSVLVLPVAYLGVWTAGVGDVVGVEGHHVAEHVGG